MPTDVKSAFDIAFWFVDTAFNENEYMQPQKLQRLLFISQAYYSIAYPKRKLMPAVFVADEMGPVEPNVYLAFSKGRPDLDVDIFLPHEVDGFLSSIWRQFGHHSVERLNELTNETVAYKQARAKGDRVGIPLDLMTLSFVRGATAPQVQHVLKPKVMRTQHGKQVIVKAWNPGEKPARRHS
jgi:uncharacterized phage-associated protein